MTQGQNESLDFAERWMRDSLQLVRPAFSVAQISADMTNALQKLDDLRKRGVQVTSTHLLVQAAARALAANPELHQMVAGNRRHRPDHIEIGLSISGDYFISPILILSDPERKTLEDLAAEMVTRAPEAREANRRLWHVLRTWGRLLPFSFMRRSFLRILFSSPMFHRKGVGTFQVSTTPAEWAMGSAFNTAGLLVGGQVKSQVVAVDGQPAVRPIMKLTLSVDHGTWDGRAATRFLAAVKTDLEQENT